MTRRLSSRWQRLSRRERQLMVLGAIALLALSVQYLILLPLESWQQRQQQHREQAWRDLQWFQLQTPRIEALQKQHIQIDRASLPALLQRTAEESQTRLGEWQDNRVLLPPQSFPALINWLIQLEIGYALQPVELNLQRHTEGLMSGKVRFNADE